MIDRKKIALIQVAKTQLGLTDDDYRAVLKRYGNADSSKDLDDAGFTAVMAHFERCGFTSTAKKRNFGNQRPGMASASQVAKIRTLWSAFTEGTGTDATLGKWLDRTFKVSSIRFVTVETAKKAIGALTAMADKKAAPAAGNNPAAPTAA